MLDGISGGRSLAEMLLHLAEAAHLDNHPYVRARIMASAIEPSEEDDLELARMLQLAAMEQKLVGNPFERPDTDQLHSRVQPPFVILGRLDTTDVLFLYSLDDFCRHGAIFGANGTGKTMLLGAIAYQTMKWAPQIHRYNAEAARHAHPPRPIPTIWCFDRSKRDFRWLAAAGQNSGFSVVVFDDRSFVFNPLEVPENVPPDYVAETFVRVFCKENNVLDLGDSLLRTAIYTLYERHGVFQGGQEFPTLFDVRDELKQQRFHPASANGRSRDSLVSKLDACLVTREQTYGASRGFPICELAQTNLVLELTGLSEAHASWLTNVMLHLLFQWRWSRHERGSHLRNLIMIDEAKWAVSEHSSGRGNHEFAPIAEIISKGRETGIGFIFADQTAHLDETVFVNTALKICFRLGDGADMDRIRKRAKLSEEEALYIPKLGTAEAIVRIPQVKPFLIRIPKVRLAEGS